MRIHCSGIGGIGLSAYAALRNAEGHEVSGSDRAQTALTDDLQSQGIDVTFDQDGSAVTEDIDLLVYSEAIPPSAPERAKAEELDIPQASYFKALGELSKDRRVIAVSGTHGKSSTTAMAAKVLIELGLDPTVVVGTKLKELDGRNWRRGQSDLFLVEACEYRRSFHYLSPDIILLLNADGDHFDAYDSVEGYQSAYVDFLRLLPSDGIVLTHMADPDCAKVVAEAGVEAVDCDDQPLTDMITPGRHMQENGQLVHGLAKHLGLEESQVTESLSGFAGTWRRMEEKGIIDDDILVVDDYAHHPVEIAASLTALKERHKGRRLVCVFQPHTHDRTIRLYDDFVSCFSSADVLLLADVYEARKDIECEAVDLDALINDIAARGVDVDYAGPPDFMALRLKRDVLKPGDLVVCMGAGTITNVATELVEG